MLEISWKSFGNHCRPCFEIVENLSTRLVVGKSSEVVGNLRRSSELFQNLQQSSEAIGKSLEIQML